MTEQELKELFDLLEKAGMNPQLCDTPVRYFDNDVKAGIPTEPGDVVQGEYLMLPRSLVGWNLTFVVNVRGDSMREAGISDGDRVQVQTDVEVRDGDIVLASIDGKCTIKAFYTDEQGQKWLVPRNDEYEAILLTEDMNVNIVGKIIGHIKDAPRVSYSECMKTIKRTREAGRAAVSRQCVEMAVKAVAGQVAHGRQWYAVYRAMADRGAVSDGDYAGFARLVAELVPEHNRLPMAGELRRMAVQSFSRPVALWNPKDAPVTGQRFDDYLRIAQMTAEKMVQEVI